MTIAKRVNRFSRVERYAIYFIIFPSFYYSATSLCDEKTWRRKSRKSAVQDTGCCVDIKMLKHERFYTAIERVKSRRQLLP